MSQLSMTLPSGTQLLRTQPLQTLLAAAPIAVVHRRIVVVDGPTGCGKTTALAELARQRSDDGVFYACIDPRSNDKTVLSTVYEAVTGDRPRPRVRQVDLRHELRLLLAGSAPLVMLDEAQNAGVSGLEMLRILHGDPTARWGLLLAGAGLNAHLAKAPMLANRVGLRVTFDKLPGYEAPDVLAALHPLYAGMPVKLIDRADVLYANGELRRWVTLLNWLLELTDNAAKPVTGEILDAALDLVGAADERQVNL